MRTSARKQVRTRIRRLRHRSAPVPLTPRVVHVCHRFGVQPFARQPELVSDLTLALEPGTITLLVGPSGSGKSSVLRELMARFPAARDVGRVSLPPDRPVVEAVAADRPFEEASSLLSACGLGEPRLWLHRYDELSDGERFRVRLAMAVSLHLSAGTLAPIVCDEFAAVLHRRIAKAIAFNLRKLVTSRSLCLVAATSADDTTGDLQPDQLIRLTGGGRCVVECRRPKRKAVSLSRRLVIARCGRRDYDQFASMHYRARDELGFVDRCFVMREGTGGEPLGIVIYAHSPLELKLRNQETGGRFKQNARRLNREMRILRRLVIHPDVRGCGFGHRLVRETLPKAGTRFVECLANMGQVNPVFEKAGMKRIGVCEAPRELKRIKKALEAMDVNPLSPGFVTAVCRRPRVRRLVAEAVRQWYRGLTRGGEQRVARQSPAFLAKTYRQMVGSAPVYYLWDKTSQVKDER